MISFVIALIIVLLWMIFYYGKWAGAFADVALLVNLLFHFFGILAGLGAVLTFRIAGIIDHWYVGWCQRTYFWTDSRRAGQREGATGCHQRWFSTTPLSSILDANITTGLTGLILLVFGTGPFKDLPQPYWLVSASLFTAIFVTDFYRSLHQKWQTLTCATALTKTCWRMSTSILEKRKIAYIISGILILISLISLFTKD